MSFVLSDCLRSSYLLQFVSIVQQIFQRGKFQWFTTQGRAGLNQRLHTYLIILVFVGIFLWEALYICVMREFCRFGTAQQMGQSTVDTQLVKHWRAGIKNNVPLMLVRTLPVTGTYTYEPNRPPCYRLPGPVRRFRTVTIGLLRSLRSHFSFQVNRYKEP